MKTESEAETNPMEQIGITVEPVSILEDEDIRKTIVDHWKESWNAAGYSDSSFVDDWEDKTVAFLDAARSSGLTPRTFVARNCSSGLVLASIHCQVWAGPLPWVVKPDAFQLGTVWGIHVSNHVKDPALDGLLRKNLLKVAINHLESVCCSKVVTLARTPMERDALVRAGVGFQAANMLTLDLANFGEEKLKIDSYSNSNKFVCGPVNADFDATVCFHWRQMWNEVGIPGEAFLPNMEGMTCSFLEMARTRLNYQTFLARCASTQKVVGSVSCQIWEGPFPKIVGSEDFQMGTVWAVYVDPKCRRQGVATTLMKQALTHLRIIGCDTVILIAASEGGQRCYERLGFRPNNALVCDVQRSGSSEKSTENEVASGEVNEEKNVEECSIGSLTEVSADIVHDLQQALTGLVSVTTAQANAMRTATSKQLLSVFGDHPRGHDILAAVSSVQKKHGTYVDPKDNWFTQNVKKFGRGFNMKQLQSDPLALKFDRLSTHYDHWTVGNSSKVESFIVQSAKNNASILLPRSQDTPSSVEVRILDVACGIGLQGQVLRLFGFQGELVGTDISSGMIKRAQERGCYNRTYVANANKDLSSLQCGESGPELYDVVICTGAMELLNQARVLTQLAKVTRQGGEIWVSFQHKTTSDPTKNPTRHQNVQGIALDEAIGLLHQAGFDNVLSVETCTDAFYTPSPAQDGTLCPVPYLFITARKEGCEQPESPGEIV